MRQLMTILGLMLAISSMAGVTWAGAGAVYTMTNDPAGNTVLAYERMADGSLRFDAPLGTGGLGSGDGLGNQGAVVLSNNGRWLLVVNPGSNDLSVFAIGAQGVLTLKSIEHTQGVRPISVAIHRDLVYVLHAGGSVGDVDSIAGLRLHRSGVLEPLIGSSRPLSEVSTAPAQIGFSPDGSQLIVTEKATSNILSYQLDEDGYASMPQVTPSNGQTPFAFDFGKRDQLFVSEVFGGAEDLGAVSSYQLEADGSLSMIDPSVPNTETAPCWLVVDQAGRFAYTTNTPDDSLSSYGIDNEGRLSLLDPDGRSGEPGPGTRPLDMDLSDNGRYLYTLNIGDGTIGSFGVGSDGSLELLGAVGGLPAGVNGLAAR